MDQEDINCLVGQIISCDLISGQKAYLINTKFVEQMRSLRGNSSKIPKVTNSALKSSGRLKPNLKRDQDYYAVTEDVWQQIEFNCGGGPVIQCNVLDDGTVELFPLQFSIKFGTNTKDLRASRMMPMDEFFQQVALTFGVCDFDIYPMNCPGAIACVGIVGDSLVGQNKLELRLQGDYVPIYEPVVPKQNVTREHSLQQTGHSNTKKDSDSNARRNVVRAPVSNKPAGLRNIGNSCYMNATLQALRCLTGLYEMLDAIKDETDQPSLTPVFCRVCRELSSVGIVVDPTSFKKSIGGILPFLQGNTQEDAHEFSTFLLDILAGECSSATGVMKSLFFGKVENLTTCAHCGYSSPIIETFSSVSVPVSLSRRAVFSPYDLAKPMMRICVPPDTPSILIGTRYDGRSVITDQMLPEFVEVYILEKPEVVDGYGLAIMRITDKESKNKASPILLQVPLNRNIPETELISIIQERIRILVPGKITKMTLVCPPSKFTMSDGKHHCNEMLSARVDQKVTTGRLIPGTGPIPIQELVSTHFSDSVLDVDNQWKCTACEKDSCAYHSIRMIECPRSLIIHLKRFRLCGGHYSKDVSEVIIPETLDMSPFLKSERIGDAVYELRSVVNHMGTIGSGHYIAHGLRSGKWYTFNDGSVTETTAPTASSGHPYLLFYELSSA